ncbi:hypothetical protein [Azospirillum halopraeferens]|uniref:hypothetical protein n=1 Tax=Azospirillum halopraeferens TaxID=34010 RepID=UPI0012EBD7F9|nr:hypothetical protein [Azospirillum halopraeferens]
MPQLAPTALAPLPAPPGRRDAARRTPPAGRSAPPAAVEPHVDRLRGPCLVLLWLGMLAASWLAATALGYGLYALLRTLIA